MIRAVARILRSLAIYLDDLSAKAAIVEGAADSAIRHVALGESVGAAILPRAGSRPSAAEIRAFAAVRISEFKVPDVDLQLHAVFEAPTLAAFATQVESAGRRSRSA